MWIIIIIIIIIQNLYIFYLFALGITVPQG